VPPIRTRIEPKTRNSRRYFKRVLCLHETGLNCQNVTTGSWKSGLNNLLDLFSQNGLGTRRCQSSYQWTDELANVDSGFVGNKRLGLSQRCCCDVVKESVVPGPRESLFQNVVVGIRTGVPIF
jgi:hypothetical protein